MDPDAPPCQGKVTVRLLGVDVAAGTEHTLEILGVSAVQGGGAVPATFTASGLARFPVTGAYRMAVLAPAQDGGAVEVTLRTGRDDLCYAGWLVAGEGTPVPAQRCFRLSSSCLAPIQFRFDPAKVRPDSCHVVVALDLGKTVQRPWGEFQFLPSYRVEY